MTINYSIGIYRRLLYCDACKTYTVHHQLQSGEWICWCARVITIEEELGTRAIISGGEVLELPIIGSTPDGELPY